MPSGKVHDSIAVFSIIPVFFIGHYFFHANLFNSLFFTISVIFSQLMFGPDLDAKSTQYKRWGFFQWIWLPYKMFIPHRSKFSHGLIWGPVLRCLYIIIIFVIITVILNQIVYMHTGIDFKTYLLPKLIKSLSCYKLSFFMLIISGLFIGAGIHTITDKIFSFFKNLF